MPRRNRMIDDEAGGAPDRPRTEPRQGMYWLCTAPHHTFTPYHLPFCNWLLGQLEIGEGGYLHWQFVIGLKKKMSVVALKRLFMPEVHFKYSTNAGANDYCLKEETRVSGTQFEFGSRALKRNSKADWDKIFDHAKKGELDQIPADIRFHSYRTIKQIAADFARPVRMERSCIVYWGPTNNGKSHRAWEEAESYGEHVYPKCSRTKWWCGYRNEEYCVMDEFDGAIDIVYLLRWLDKWPTGVEPKGSYACLNVKKWWITSNVHPKEWYPNAKPEHIAALLRRMTVVHCPINMA